MNKNAIISMILGIIASVLSFVLPLNNVAGGVLLVFGIGAIIFSVLAKKELNKMKNKGEGKGKGQATAGMVLGIINAVMGLMVFLVVFAISDPEVASLVYCIEPSMVSECTTPSDDAGISTCKYMGSVDIKCKKEVLKKEQYIEE
jgi:hypothetical protein